MFKPNFQISPKAVQALMDVEVSRQAVASLPVSAQLLTSLRESARLNSTHYSTQIEGNRLTQEEVAVVVKGGTFPNRKRDETEVKNYFRALDFVDELIEQSAAELTAEMIQKIHGAVMEGRPNPTPYRDGQNVIRESGAGNIIYMPPESKDVPQLMEDLVDWINIQLDHAELAAPIIAALAHYQFATIHPYFDGNGRTARLLTNLILHRAGYGLKGIYSLEEYYARNLEDYYAAISVGDSHNYYLGRAEADVGQWIEYFCQGMADSFVSVRVQAEKFKVRPDHTKLLRELDAKQKRILDFFRESRFLTTREIAEHLGVTPRTALNVCHTWLENGFILSHGEKKNRRYELTDTWVELL
jgi:Fic family protein